jgi:formate hydrogenlyase transcriptional activator
MERGIVLTVLNELDWVIGGTNGAAAKLGLKRTTFLYKMKKLGINRAMRQT